MRWIFVLCQGERAFYAGSVLFWYSTEIKGDVRRGDNRKDTHGDSLWENIAPTGCPRPLQSKFRAKNVRAVGTPLYSLPGLWQPAPMPAKIAAPAPDATADFTLADGTRLTARVRRSARARRARLSLAPDGDLLLTVPGHWSPSAVDQALPRFLPWLERAWQRYQRRAPEKGLPNAVVLPLPGLEFRVETAGDLAEGRRHSQARAHSLLVSQGTRRLLLLETPGLLRLFGPPEDAALGALALRRWCREQAARLLPPYLLRLAAREGFAVSGVSVRDQRSRWGSCSRTRPDAREQRAARPRRSVSFKDFLGRLLGGKSENEPDDGAAVQNAAGHINLNWRALLLPVPLLEHLCWHELCHLRQMNHSPAYRAELARFSPHWPDMEKELNRAWRDLPWWALPGTVPDARNR